MNDDKKYIDPCIKELTPGIQRNDEKKLPPSNLKNEELFFRALAK